jgi:hypothetical protein
MCFPATAPLLFNLEPRPAHRKGVSEGRVPRSPGLIWDCPEECRDYLPIVRASHRSYRRTHRRTVDCGGRTGSQLARNLQHYGDPGRLMATRQAISVRRSYGRIFIDGGLILVLVTIVLTLILATMGTQLYAVLIDVVAAMS